MALFKGTSPIILQASDADIDYTFHFPIATSDTANNGAIKYDTTISGATTSAKNSAGDMITSLIDATNVSGDDDVILTLSYPNEGVDRYAIKFILTLSDSSTKEFDFNRVYAKDI